MRRLYHVLMMKSDFFYFYFFYKNFWCFSNFSLTIYFLFSVRVFMLYTVLCASDSLFIIVHAILNKK